MCADTVCCSCFPIIKSSRHPVALIPLESLGEEGVWVAGHILDMFKESNHSDTSAVLKIFSLIEGCGVLSTLDVCCRATNFECFLRLVKVRQTTI